MRQRQQTPDVTVYAAPFAGAAIEVVAVTAGQTCFSLTFAVAIFLAVPILLAVPIYITGGAYLRAILTQ